MVLMACRLKFSNQMQVEWDDATMKMLMLIVFCLVESQNKWNEMMKPGKC